MKRRVVSTVVILGVLSGCSLWLLPDEDFVRSTPASANEILDAEEEPALSFRQAVDRESVESIFFIEDNSGRIDGRLTWSENTVSFTAQPPLQPGVRYTLRFSGEYTDADEAVRSSTLIVPFYYISDSTPIRVVASRPESGAIIPPETSVEIEFSAPVEQESLDGRIVLSPSGDRTVALSADRQLLTIAPRTAWTDGTVYSVQLREGIQSEDGTQLQEDWEVTFLVQEDTQPPELVSVQAAQDDEGVGFPSLGEDLETFLGPDDVLRFTFSEAMDRESVESALQFEPDETESAVWVDDTTVVYRNGDHWSESTTYTYYFDGAVTDLFENQMVMPDAVAFTPASGYTISLAVTFTRDDPPGTLDGEDFSTVDVVDITVSVPHEDEYTFEIDFGAAIFATPVEKEAVRDAINVAAIFPDDLGSPIVSGFSWPTDSILSITYYGFEASTVTEDNLYLLTIGTTGSSIRASDGSRLEAPAEQILRAIE